MEKLLRNADLEKCNALSTPGVKESSDLTCNAWFEESGLEHGEVGALLGADLGPDNPELRLLDRDEMRDYRSAVARCNYLAQDRFEIAFTTKELCRAMAKPTVGDAKAITRLYRFLKGVPRLVQKIPFSEYPPSIIEVYVDSDWAGCRKSRKSTSGGVLMFGGSAVRGWSSNQSVIALSSGEAEYYAALKVASAAMGFQAMLADLGITAKIILYTDSFAARGIIHRAGLGKLRHLETGYLWLQAAAKAKRLQVRKVLGSENPADLFTKHLAATDMWKHLETLQISIEEGRTEAVLAI